MPNEMKYILQTEYNHRPLGRLLESINYDNFALMFTTKCSDEKKIMCRYADTNECENDVLSLLGRTALQTDDGFWDTIQNCPQCGCDENGATPLSTLYYNEIRAKGENAEQYEIDFVNKMKVMG